MSGGGDGDLALLPHNSAAPTVRLRPAGGRLRRPEWNVSAALMRAAMIFGALSGCGCAVSAAALRQAGVVVS